MSKNKRYLKPWWRRRYWQWACGMTSMCCGIVGISSGYQSLGWRPSSRGEIGVESAALIVVVCNDQWVQSGWGASPSGVPAIAWPFGKFMQASPPRRRLAGEGISPVLRQIRNAMAAPRLAVAVHVGDTGAASSGVVLPLGWPAMVFAGLSAFGFYRAWKHRYPLGLCAKCGYDLSGIAIGSACPECGKAATSISL